MLLSVSVTVTLFLSDKLLWLVHLLLFHLPGESYRQLQQNAKIIYFLNSGRPKQGNMILVYIRDVRLESARAVSETLKFGENLARLWAGLPLFISPQLMSLQLLLYSSDTRLVQEEGAIVTFVWFSFLRGGHNQCSLKTGSRVKYLKCKTLFNYCFCSGKEHYSTFSTVELL